MLLVRHEWFVPTLLINLESITGKKINSVYLHNVRVNSAYTVPLVKQLDVWNDEEFISTVSQIYPTLPPNQSVNLNYTFHRKGRFPTSILITRDLMVSIFWETKIFAVRGLDLRTSKFVWIYNKRYYVKSLAKKLSKALNAEIIPIEFRYLYDYNMFNTLELFDTTLKYNISKSMANKEFVIPSGPSPLEVPERNVVFGVFSDSYSGDFYASILS